MKTWMNSLLAAAVMAGSVSFSEENLQAASIINLSGQLGGEEITLVTHNLIININSSPVLGYIHGSEKNGKGTAITLNFSENNRLLCSQNFQWSATTLSFDIEADTETQQAWAEGLFSKRVADVPLISAGGLSLTSSAPVEVTLLGQNLVGGELTLGGHKAEYMGYFTSLSDAQKSITGLNQLAVVGSAEDGGLFLVGKMSRTSAAPEPATATLSLLALAALVARRKRK